MVLNILFDIWHPADCNFFKNPIEALRKDGHNIFLTVYNRGNLIDIVNSEYPEYDKSVIGSYFESKLDLPKKMLLREWEFLKYFRGKSFDVTVGFGSPLLAFASKLQSIFTLQFIDEFEAPLVFNLTKYLSDKFVIPFGSNHEYHNIEKFKGYKELSYLHPKYFKPNASVLQDYKLIKNRYVFVRAVSNTSVNHYQNINEFRMLDLVRKLSTNHQVVLSLENKNLKKRFSPYCYVLEEPVSDIYSLMYYASVVISSGETVAREGALVGTPVIFCGGMEVLLHKELIDNKLMFNLFENVEIISKLEELKSEKIKDETRSSVNRLIDNKWENPVDIIVQKIYELKND